MELCQLASELTLAKSEFDRAARRLALVREQLNKNSLINCFPDEIIAEIFEQCLPDKITFTVQEHNLMTMRNYRITPLLFAGICRRWRSVATSTPRLWRDVEIYVSIKRYESQISVLEDWLRYSGDLSLTILINICTKEDLRYWAGHSPCEIARVLAKHSERWETAYLAIPLASFSDIPAVPFPRLTSLTLQTCSFFNADTSKMLGMADQITFLELLSTQANLFDLPKGRIQRLKVKFISAQECYDLVRRNPDVVDCYFEGPYLYPSFSYPQVVRLEKLEKLYIAQYHQECVGVFFDSITVPAIRRFEFGARANEVPFRQMISMFRRSHCKIQTLVLEHIDMDDTDLMSILQAVPTLTEFRLVIMGVDTGRTTTNRLLHMMTPQHPALEGQACLLPNLEKLNFEAPYIYEEDAMVDFIVSRWRKNIVTGEDPHCAQLKYATVINNGSQAENDLALRVQSCADEGMKVDFRRFTYPPNYFVD